MWGQYVVKTRTLSGRKGVSDFSRVASQSLSDIMNYLIKAACSLVEAPVRLGWAWIPSTRIHLSG